MPHGKNIMKNTNKTFHTLVSATLEYGAYKATVIDADQIETDRSFRALCESNACGVYGKCYMCPPDIGDIDELMQKVKNYDYALVYQTVSELEDSYDFEGMVSAKKQFYPLSQALRKVFDSLNISKALHLSAGGCGVCRPCAKQAGEPCRYPELAMASLEAYGINVSRLASVADMKYINGQNTVTYFGAILFSLEDGVEK